MKYKNKLLIFLSLLLMFMPYYVFAYSPYVVLGGDNVGIEVKSDGVLVVGFYKVDNEYIGKNSGIQLGDKLIKVESTSVSTIEEMISAINKNIKNSKVNITVLRDEKELPISLNLVKDNQGIYKTGLYIKDKIVGLGTLSYVDPENNAFGVLGHEIVNWRSITK